MLRSVTYTVSRAARILSALLDVRAASTSAALPTLRTTSSILPFTSAGSVTGPTPAALAVSRKPVKLRRLATVSPDCRTT